MTIRNEEKKGRQNRPSEDCAAVTIAYHPKPELLVGQLQVLCGKVARLIVVDNGGTLSESDFSDVPERVDLLRPGENLGVAGGQNLGIERARNAGCRYVLLMDQDSLPEADMVDELWKTLEYLQGQNIRAGAVGPYIADYRGRPGRSAPFAKATSLWYRYGEIRSGQQAAEEVAYLLDSGSLIRLDVLKEAGNKLEELFIDYVDIEWYFRARQKGYRFFVAPAARMKHALGSLTKKRLGPITVHLIQHEPFRYYYIYRNSILIMRLRTIPLGWKLFTFLVRFVLRGPELMFHDSPRAKLRMAARGTWAGMRGRTGKLSEIPD